MPTLNSIVTNYLVPLLPGKWRLPFSYWKYCRSVQAEPELIHLQKIPTKFRVAVDVGANQGLYSYKMSHHFQKVYAFEINPALTLNLRRYGARNIQVFDHGLSSQVGDAVLYTPVLANGFELTGWSSLSREDVLQEMRSLLEQPRLAEKPVQIGLLDQYDLQEVDLIKIDVEGHELEVLKGATETLRSNRPHLVIETKSRLPEVDKFLADLEYRRTPFKGTSQRAASQDLYLYAPQPKENDR